LAELSSVLAPWRTGAISDLLRRARPGTTRGPRYDHDYNALSLISYKSIPILNMKKENN
jgi:hypothetical protein